MQPGPYIPTITNYTKIWWVPNVVVAHQKEGIEVLHLASGRTACKVISTDRHIFRQVFFFFFETQCID